MGQQYTQLYKHSTNTFYNYTQLHTTIQHFTQLNKTMQNFMKLYKKYSTAQHFTTLYNTFTPLLQHFYNIFTNTYNIVPKNKRKNLHNLF